MALVLRNGVRGGARLAWWTGLGCCAGIAVYAVASAIGLAAVLAASSEAFTVIKLVGAVYLVYLGATALWHSRKTATEEIRQSSTATATPEPTGQRTLAFRQGMVSNLLNPKIALIFLTLIPQFVSTGEPTRTTGVLAAVERVTGAVLIALGVRVALTKH